MSEQEIVEANLSIPYFSPELQIWKTPLSDKLLITGTVGVNRELVETHNNYPWFNVVYPDSESEQELLDRIKSKSEEIIIILKKSKPSMTRCFY